MKKILAFDVGGTSIKCALYDAHGALLEKWQIKTDKKDCGMRIFKDIAASIRRKLPQLDQIQGIGIGVPGPVTGTFVETAVNLGWKKNDVAKALQDALGEAIPVFVENDADVAAYGEFMAHKKSLASMALLTLGTGIGGGVILDKTIHRGANGVGGEFGHFKMAETGNRCNCGNTGCLETFASATAVVHETMRKLKSGTPSTLSLDNINAKIIFEAAQAGDDLALAMVDKAAYYLGRAIGLINTALDLELVLIGGGLSDAGDFFIDKIRKHYRENTFHVVKALPIERAVLGNDAGIHGCMEVVRNHG